MVDIRRQSLGEVQAVYNSLRPPPCAGSGSALDLAGLGRLSAVLELEAYVGGVTAVSRSRAGHPIADAAAVQAHQRKPDRD